MTRKEKQAARIERFNNLAAKASNESTRAFETAHKMAEVIPFGQPILVGHHSERGDRAYRGKIASNMDKGVQLNRKAQYYEGRAEAAENNTAIFLEDEDSVELLTAKVEKLATFQENMKAINKIIASKKTNQLQKVEAIQELGISEATALKIFEPNCWGRIGFESYQLTNNNAKLKTAKERLAKAIRLKSTESSEVEINGVKMVSNTTDNRLQLFFDGKPDEETRSKLKHNGFRWTPSVGCWQSYLNRYQVDRAKDILKQFEI